MNNLLNQKERCYLRKILIKVFFDWFLDFLECKNGLADIGKLFLSILYDPTILYEGEMDIKAIDLCLHNKSGIIPFYRGKCPNKNIFSYFDGPADNEFCQIIEADYRKHDK